MVRLRNDIVYDTLEDYYSAVRNNRDTFQPGRVIKIRSPLRAGKVDTILPDYDAYLKYVFSKVMEPLESLETTTEPINGFTKHDNGKVRPSLFPIEPHRAILYVLEYGAEKYERDNWKKCKDSSRYLDACLRHLMEHQEGEKNDPESGLSHLAHAATNLIFLIQMEADSIKEQV